MRIHSPAAYPRHFTYRTYGTGMVYYTVIILSVLIVMIQASINLVVDPVLIYPDLSMKVMWTGYGSYYKTCKKMKQTKLYHNNNDESYR